MAVLTVAEAPGGPPIAALAAKLSVPLKSVFAIGSTAESMVITALGQFVLIYFNQVRGLDPKWVGLAYSAGLILNAFWDPMVGSWSDRTQSRLGRRHPFMFAAPIPVAIAFFLLFNPPGGLSHVGELVWLLCVNVVLQQSLTLFHTPHIALGGELSGDYIERSSVMNYNTFFLWAGDSLTWVLCFAWFFRPTPTHANGALDPAAYPAFAGCIAVAVAALMLTSAWLTRHKRTQPVEAQGGTAGPAALLRDVRHALSNRNYRSIVIGSVIYTLMSGVRNGLGFYISIYYWRLTNAQLSLFVIGSLIGYVFASTVVTRLHKRLDKRWTAVVAVLANTVFPLAPLALGLMGVLSPSTPGLVAILIGFGVLSHAPYSLMTTTLNSAVADVADENELKFGDREEGILFSTRAFFLRLDQALGTVTAGWVLSLIAFPAKATPGKVDAPVLLSLVGAFIACSAAGLLAAFFYGGYRIDQASYLRTRAALLKMRAERGEATG